MLVAGSLQAHYYRALFCGSAPLLLHAMHESRLLIGTRTDANSDRPPTGHAMSPPRRRNEEASNYFVLLGSMQAVKQKAAPPSACWYCSTVRVRNYSLLRSLFFVLQSLFQQNHYYFLLQAGPTFSSPTYVSPILFPKPGQAFRLKARFLTGGASLVELTLFVCLTSSAAPKVRTKKRQYVLYPPLHARQGRAS